MGDLSPNFSRYEFKCGCQECSCDTVDAELLEVLEGVREHFQAPVTINSAHRCPSHNAAVGGSDASQHKQGRAADIVVEGVDAQDVQQYLKVLYPNRFGIGSYNSFTHVDTRTFGPARWDG